MLPIYDQVRIFLSNDIVENLKFRRNIYHKRLKFLLHTSSYTFIRSTKFQDILSCWWSGFWFIFVDSPIYFFFVCGVSHLWTASPFSAFFGGLRTFIINTHSSETQEHRASSYRQASESPPHPFQGCGGPLSACHLGFFHNVSNSRRMTWATYHTPQAA